MKHLLKLFVINATLVMYALCFISSTTPGYDENNNDINECVTPGACPEGYECINLPGSYLCKGEGLLEIEGEIQSPGQYYEVKAQCIADGLCSAQCNYCYRMYTARVMGKAVDIHGICICGHTSFGGF